MLAANQLLNQTIDQRNHQLETANKELSQLLDKQSQQHASQLNNEKVETTKNLINGFAHEISAPIGIAITAVSTAESQLQSLILAFESDKLTRKVMIEKLAVIEQSISLNQRNLFKTSELMAKFQEIGFEIDQDDIEPFLLINPQA